MNIRNNKVILIAAVVLALVLTVVICVFAGKEPEGPAGTAPTFNVRPTRPTEGAVSIPPTESTPPTTVPAATETEPVETVRPTTEPTEPTEPPTEPETLPWEEPVIEPTVPTGVHFPYTIPGTELVIEALNPYSGVFLEDGSDRSAEEICAIILRNASTTCTEYVNITLTRDDGAELSFVASAIDAGSRIVVMEANAEPYQQADYTACTADVARVAHLEMSEDLIQVEVKGNGALAVTNISGEDIPCVRIFYKFYMEDVDVYIGGITYTAKIEHLAEGETRTAMPSHYAKDNSRIVMVKVYDTVDG